MCSGLSNFNIAAFQLKITYLLATRSNFICTRWIDARFRWFSSLSIEYFALVVPTMSNKICMFDKFGRISIIWRRVSSFKIQNVKQHYSLQ